MIPCEVKLYEKTYPAQWACDLMVSNDYRGAGIGAALYKEAVARKITLGSDPSPSAAILMKRFGFITLKGPTKTFFPVYLNSITDKKAKRLSGIAKRIPNPFILKAMLEGKSELLEKIAKPSFEEIDFK